MTKTRNCNPVLHEEHDFAATVRMLLSITRHYMLLPFATFMACLVWRIRLKPSNGIEIEFDWIIIGDVSYLLSYNIFG